MDQQARESAQRHRVRDWPPAAATGVGSMPGTQVRDAARAVRDELAREGAVPHLVELPARGPGADMVGRALALLSGVWPAWAAETTPTGWRLCDAPGREARRGAAFLHEDLDVLEEEYDGWRGPLVLPVAGPWTLAATVELTSGERLVRDEGAVRDLVQTWAEAAAAHVADVRRRVPGAVPVLQADEPALPAVLTGSVPTASGALRYRAVDAAVVRAGLAAAVARLDRDGVELLVHCCAGEVPLELLREAGVAGVGLDLALVGPAAEDQLGECVASGLRLGLGVVPRDGGLSDVAASVRAVTTLAGRLGFASEELAAAVTVSPPCGLAGLSPTAAKATLALARAVGRALREQDARDDEERS